MNKVENMPEFKWLLKQILTDKEYACYKGYHFDNLKQCEIAINLNINQSSVSNNLKIAEKKAESILKFATAIIKNAKKNNKIIPEYFDEVSAGQRLKEVRKMNRLTQKEVSEKLGIDVRVLAGMEKGTSSMKVVYLVALAHYYNISIDEILFGYGR